MSILESKEPSVMLLAKENYEQLFNHVVTVATNYFQICHPSLLHLAPVIASDLIRNNPSWRAADFINMFRFFRTSPTDTNLNMTYERLINRVTEYELSRTEALEVHHAKNKGKFAEDSKSLDNISPKILEKFASKDYEKPIGDMTLDYSKFQADKEKKGRTPLREIAPSENYFKKNPIPDPNKIAKELNG